MDNREIHVAMDWSEYPLQRDCPAVVLLRTHFPDRIEGKLTFCLGGDRDIEDLSLWSEVVENCESLEFELDNFGKPRFIHLDNKDLAWLKLFTA